MKRWCEERASGSQSEGVTFPSLWLMLHSSLIFLVSFVQRWLQRLLKDGWQADRDELCKTVCLRCAFWEALNYGPHRTVGTVI